MRFKDHIYRSILKLFGDNKRFKGFIYRSGIELLSTEKNWRIIERFYYKSRESLRGVKSRFDTSYIFEHAKLTYDKLSAYKDIPSQTYCELGCGEHHPIGVSAAMYINGTDFNIATDILPTDKKRAAWALYDLLLECLSLPSKWHWSNITEDEYTNRIKRFNLQALEDGNLETGISKVPIDYNVSDFCNIKINNIDLMSSHAVLEHMEDFGNVCEKLYTVMSPGGFAYHLIDLVDHRAYGHGANKKGINYWTFLTEEKASGYNRLRYSDYLKYFHKAGFEVLDIQTKKAEPPASIRKKFMDMSKQDLEVIRMSCVLRKK
jgi:hypothetical protein